MRTAMEHLNITPANMRGRMRSMAESLSWVADPPPEVGTPTWPCHAVTRAFKECGGGLLEEWEVRDGFFGRPGLEHSWLVLPQTFTHPLLVLDILPTYADGGPIMADASTYGSPWRDWYIESPVGYYTPEKIRAFEQHAKLLIDALGEY